MARPAALSSAALRVLRTAAGRRTLQGALLMGGLFALGVLFGGQAQAADGVSASTATLLSAPATAPTSATASTAAPATEATSAPAPTSQSLAVPAKSAPSLPPASKAPTTPVGDKVVRSAGELVEAVTEELAEAQVAVPPASSLPSLPKPPSSLSLPALPGLPDVPSLPSPPVLPGDQPARTLPALVASVPQAGSAVTPSSDRHGPAGPAVPMSSYGPWGAGRQTGAGVAADGVGHRAVAQVRQAPAHRAPAGDPDGVLGNAPVVDSGTSRHGDAHAVTPYHRVPLSLVPGSGVRTDAAETQDRYRDIPVFPG
ncbi:hypothetical protein [Streptomyces sp. NEAU-NA10]|uniref:hypothetical protein n=1 Tax=Streptomyces sp. NEAU-NA10 TaxID=3416050 RepID=UPI003CC6DA73